MSRSALWKLAKALEALGLVIVLVGVMWSVTLGFEDQGLESMSIEFQGLALGGILFAIGWVLERAVGTRG